MNQALRDLVLRPQDEVIVTFGSTGSETLDAQRIATLRGIIASNPARLSVIAPVTASTAAERPDIALLQVRLFKRILVTCPANGVPFDEEALNPQIREFGCASAINLAESAADKRDLSTPRELRGSDAIQSVRAVETYRTQKITVLSPEIDPSN
jgi:type IV pilus biogenesis protein CpaD/CtpE